MDMELFDTVDTAFISHARRQKKPRLGRYERLAVTIETTASDPYKIWVNKEDFQKPLLQYNFIDLFCGCGGLTQGFLQAGMNPVGSVEIVEVAANTHKLNFPSCKCFNGDIKDLSPSKYFGNKKIHLVIGGPPCQGFSVAGKRDPNDPRNKLFYEFVRVVDELKPWYVVLENVPGILTMKNGKVKDAIIREFTDIGYKNMSIAVLESANYGVPQFRPRAIFIANKYDLPNYYPNAQLGKEEYIPIEAAISDLSPDIPDPKTNHEWTKHSKEFIERLSKVSPGGSLYETFFDAFKRQYPGLPSMTIKENHGGTHIHPYLNRCISAREMARLQTFPDSFFFTGTMKKAMWQIGNAVPPLLGENIGKAVLTGLNRIVNKDFSHDIKISREGVLTF
jgi:DNA (cytosine-5)-methyltransferase 1